MNPPQSLPNTTIFSSALLASGPQFLQEICEIARRECGAHLALVGSLRIVESDEIEVLSLSATDPTLALDHYDSCPAPCRAVLTDQKVVMHLADLHTLFPDDVNIQAIQSRSYLGFPLVNLNGSTLGIFVLEWGRPITEDEAQQAIDLLSPLVPRIEHEVAQQAVAHAFQALMNPVDFDTEQSDISIFRTIVQQAAALAQVHSVVLTRADPKAGQFRVLAAVAGQEVLQDLEGVAIDYAGTPCDKLRTSDTYIEPRDLQDLYPEFALFRDLDVQSFCGFGFRDRSGDPIGHLAFLHKRPISKRMLQCRIVNIIASRAQAELQRHVIERESRALQEALSVRKKLESLGLTAGTIAHDFNNQLTAIIGHTELAMLELNQTHPATPSLKVAEDCLWRARDVIGDLMDFADNTPKAPPEAIDLNSLLARDLATMEAETKQPVRIEAEYETALPPIFGRTSQLNQVISNLTLNAFEAMDGSDAVLRVRTALVDLSDDERAKCLTENAPSLETPCVMLQIADTGKGMDPATAERVFDPYFSTKGDNRGLGLSGVIGIARRLGAGLTFETAPDQGTVFRLYFQRYQKTSGPDRTVQPTDTASPPSADFGKVLVVDDEPLVLRTVAFQLKSLGYTPITATQGTEATEIAQDHPDLVAAVIDMVMPGLDGRETLRRLRHSHPNLPAVLMSGYVHADAQAKDAHDKGVLVMVKPFALRTLQTALEQTMKGAVGGVRQRQIRGRRGALATCKTICFERLKF